MEKKGIHWHTTLVWLRMRCNGGMLWTKR